MQESGVARRSIRGHPTGEQARTGLRHIVVVGGSLAEWNALTSPQWARLRGDLATVCARVGAMWLTIRPYSDSPAGGGAVQRSIDVREGCTVTVDPCADGQDRLIGAIQQLRDTSVAIVDEAVIAGILMSPAPCEPDLTVVLGASSRLPRTLVWDLAYCELVFIDTAWSQLSGTHLETAIGEYSRRHRRFGGIE